MKLFNNKIEVQLPPYGFKKMGEEQLGVRYLLTAERPQEVFVNDKEVIFAFNHTYNKMPIGDIEKYRELHEAQFNRPTIDFKRSQLIKVNKQPFVAVEFSIPYAETTLYNLIYTTSLEDRQFLAAFNCFGEEVEEWKPIGEKVLNSIVILNTAQKIKLKPTNKIKIKKRS